MISTFLYNQYRSGQTENGLKSLDKPELLWKLQLSSDPAYGIETMTMADADKNLYVGCHNGKLYSVNQDGKKRFEISSSQKMFGTPIVLNDKCVFCSGSGELNAIDLEGNLKWKLELSDIPLLEQKVNYFDVLLRKFKLKPKPPKFSVGTIRNWSSLNYFNEHIYLNVAGKGLCVVSKDGQLIQNFKGKYDFPLAGTAIFSDGSMVYTDERRYLYKLDSNHKLEWTYDIGDYYLWSNPTIDKAANFTYFSGTKNSASKICCVDDKGQIIWDKKINSEIRGTLSISSFGYVLVPLFNGQLLALDKASGKQVFNTELCQGDRALWTTPTIDNNGNILIAVRKTRYEGCICALDADGKLLWSIDCGKTLSPPFLDDHGRIYFGDWLGYYYCYQS
ncbi:MAG: PQQ-binding-like beta-propeller repeat protein [Bacteroidota bacterium]